MDIHQHSGMDIGFHLAQVGRLIFWLLLIGLLLLQFLGGSDTTRIMADIAANARGEGKGIPVATAPAVPATGPGK